MKKIRIKFCDGFLGGGDVILPMLKRHYDVELSETPDYVVYSVFGKENLKHPDAVRIFMTGECCTPDFNACDYGIGFDYLDCGDRYLRHAAYWVPKSFRAHIAAFVQRCRRSLECRLSRLGGHGCG